MTNCNGTVRVKEHTREGNAVSAYTRACPFHKGAQTQSAQKAIPVYNKNADNHEFYHVGEMCLKYGACCRLNLPIPEGLEDELRLYGLIPDIEPLLKIKENTVIEKADIPVPKEKTSFMKGYDQEGSWDKFVKATKDAGLSETSRKVLSNTFAFEGFDVADGTTFGGITQDTLDDAVKRKTIEGVKKDTKSSDLTFDQKVAFYKGYGDHLFRLTGGLEETVEKIADEKISMLIFDTAYRHGKEGGQKILHKSVTESAPEETDPGEGWGKDTLNIVQKIIGDQTKKAKFLEEMKKRRDNDKSLPGDSARSSFFTQ